LERGKTKRRQRSERDSKGPRPSKDGALRLRVLAALAAVAAVGCLAVLGGFLMLTRGAGQAPSHKAAIIDQLSVRIPNPSFVQSATLTLESAGYSVDYYEADQVNVGFFRDLPTHGYDLIILRAHSAVPRKDLSLPTDVDPAIVDRIMSQIGDDVLLFTSEQYNDKAYLDEQKAMRLFPVVYTGDQGSNTYFAVSSRFVQSSMRGQFHDTTIILMGCSSLATDKTAAALVRKGARAVAGWTDMVTPEHTDGATEQLLQYLLEDHLPMGEAVGKTNDDLGADPSFGSTMRAYPSGN
jgi:hypothetical protein